MKLIDADALRERLLVLRCNITNVQCISDIFDICLTEVSNAPTVPERQKGEWKRHDEWVHGIYVGGFYHVNCPNENGYYSKWTYNFCPNCGADMRGDEE